MPVTPSRVSGPLNLEGAKTLSETFHRRAAAADLRRKKAEQSKKARALRQRSASRLRNRENREVFVRLLLGVLRDEGVVKLINPTSETVSFLKELGCKSRTLFRRDTDRDELICAFEHLEVLASPLRRRLGELTFKSLEPSFTSSRLFKQWVRDYPRTHKKYRLILTNFESLLDVLHQFEEEKVIDSSDAAHDELPYEVLGKGLHALYERLTGESFYKEDYVNRREQILKIRRDLEKLQRRIDLIVEDPDFIYTSATTYVLEVECSPSSSRKKSGHYAHCLMWASSPSGKVFYAAISRAIKSCIIKQEKKLLVEISDGGQIKDQGLLPALYGLPSRKRPVEGPPLQFARLMLAPLGFAILTINKQNRCVLEISGW